MNILQIVTMVNELVAGLTALDFNLSQVADLQEKAAREGRRLSIEDFKQLRDTARANLIKLDEAIAEAEQAEQE